MSKDTFLPHLATVWQLKQSWILANSIKHSWMVTYPRADPWNRNTSHSQLHMKIHPSSTVSLQGENHQSMCDCGVFSDWKRVMHLQFLGVGHGDGRPCSWGQRQRASWDHGVEITDSASFSSVLSLILTERSKNSIWAAWHIAQFGCISPPNHKIWIKIIFIVRTHKEFVTRTLVPQKKR